MLSLLLFNIAPPSPPQQPPTPPPAPPAPPFTPPLPPSSPSAQEWNALLGNLELVGVDDYEYISLDTFNGLNMSQFKSNEKGIYSPKVKLKRGQNIISDFWTIIRAEFGNNINEIVKYIQDNKENEDIAKFGLFNLPPSTPPSAPSTPPSAPPLLPEALAQEWKDFLGNLKLAGGEAYISLDTFNSIDMSQFKSNDDGEIYSPKVKRGKNIISDFWTIIRAEFGNINLEEIVKYIQDNKENKDIAKFGLFNLAPSTPPSAPALSFLHGYPFCREAFTVHRQASRSELRDPVSFQGLYFILHDNSTSNSSLTSDQYEQCHSDLDARLRGFCLSNCSVSSMELNGMKTLFWRMIM